MVAACHPSGQLVLSSAGPADRGEAIGEMSRSLERYLLSEYQSGRVSGVLGIGGKGSGGWPT